MPFPMLFSVIGKHLSSSSITTLEHHYTDFKQRRITREDLIKRVRMIAGDKLLIAAIKSIKSQEVINLQTMALEIVEVVEDFICQ